MAIVAISIYLLIIIGLGVSFIRSRLSGDLLLLGGFCIGSALLAICFFLLAWAFLLTKTSIVVVIAISIAIAARSIRELTRAFKEAVALYRKSLTEVLPIACILVCLLILAVYLADAMTPPRSDDAMRYHLTQLKDIVQHGGLFWRPYIHFNFPIYFSTLFAPIFMFLGGGSMQVLQVLLVCVILGITLTLGRLVKSRLSVLTVGLLLLTPWFFRVSTTVNNDLGTTIFSLLGIVFLASCRSLPDRSGTLRVLAFVSLGIALGMKHMAVLLIPAYAFAAFESYPPQLTRLSRSVSVVFLLCLSLLIVGPFYAKHILNTQNPVWPFFQNILPTRDTYLGTLGTQYLRLEGGRFSVYGLIKSVINGFVATVYWLPAIWLVIIVGAWNLRRESLRPLHLIVIYFGGWFMFQTHLLTRFAIYIYPALLVVAVAAIERSKIKWIRVPAFGLITLQLLFGASVLVAYSRDFFVYRITGNKEQFLETSFYYSEYEWINLHLPRNARLLVVVVDARTYYLDRWYLRADPYDSAAISWPKIGNAGELLKVLGRRRIDYVLYSAQDWSHLAGGRNMMRILAQLRQNPECKVLWDKNVRLCLSRTAKQYRTVRTWLLKIPSAKVTVGSSQNPVPLRLAGRSCTAPSGPAIKAATSPLDGQELGPLFLK